MTRIRIGAALVSLWAGSNLILGLGIVIAMAVFGRSPPSYLLFVSEADRAATPASSVALIHSLALLFNGCAASVCALVLAATWLGVVRRVRWTLFAVAGSTVLVQACGFVSDAFLGNRNLAANLVSALVLGVGLALASGSREGAAP